MNEPEPPVDTPNYLREGLPKQSPAMLRALSRWAEDLAAYKEEQPPEIDEDDQMIAAVEPGHVGGVLTDREVPALW